MPFDDWSREKAIEEYQRIVSALQYTIGERDRTVMLLRLLSEAMEPGKYKLFSKVMKIMHMTKSERFQDIFCLLASGGKQGGYFVEFGACDGIAASNTYLLEKYCGWTGILAEPATCWHKRLAENRTAIIDKRCVSGVTGKSVELFQAKTQGTSSLYENHKFLGEVTDKYTVQTVTLGDLLKEHNAPEYIDFLSIDTEGHEKEALASFDFRKHRFGFICVEQHPNLAHDNDVSVLLDRAGYAAIFPRFKDKSKPPSMQVSGVDAFYVEKTNPFLRQANRWFNYAG